jgi:hypothetical protein
MNYGVFDNDKPASSKGFPNLKGEGWATHLFTTYEEALGYAHDWLGEWGDGIALSLGKKVDYSGYGDTIEIREIV